MTGKPRGENRFQCGSVNCITFTLQPSCEFPEVNRNKFLNNRIKRRIVIDTHQFTKGSLSILQFRMPLNISNFAMVLHIKNHSKQVSNALHESSMSFKYDLKLKFNN